LNFLIQANDVNVRICQERALGLHVERDDARATERFDPAVEFLRLSELADFTNQFGFDPLALQRRNKRWQAHSLSSSAFPASSSASSIISFSWARSVSAPRFL